MLQGTQQPPQAETLGIWGCQECIFIKKISPKTPPNTWPALQIWDRIIRGYSRKLEKKTPGQFRDNQPNSGQLHASKRFFRTLFSSSLCFFSARSFSIARLRRVISPVNCLIFSSFCSFSCLRVLSACSFSWALCTRDCFCVCCSFHVFFDALFWSDNFPL